MIAPSQIQMRDLPGFLETRQTLLELKATNRQNWLAFAVAHHLNGNHDVAVKVLDSYGATMDEEAAAHEPYETSEVLLYKAQILEEGGWEFLLSGGVGLGWGVLGMCEGGRRSQSEARRMSRQKTCGLLVVMWGVGWSFPSLHAKEVGPGHGPTCWAKWSTGLVISAVSFFVAQAARQRRHWRPSMRRSASACSRTGWGC